MTRLITRATRGKVQSAVLKPCARAPSIASTITRTLRSKSPTVGLIWARAIFNVSPELAGRYFTKIECFCFKQQTLAAGQTVDMPVTFFVDPKFVDDEDTKDISEITLSYTFYPSGEVNPPAAAAAPEGDGSKS